MPRLTHLCPRCKRPAEIVSEAPLGSLINYVYKCGHIELREKLVFESETHDDESFNALNGHAKRAYDFQIEGINFIEASGINCLVADAMGLGKTIQALVALKRNKKLMCPCLIIVKNSVMFQWARELKTWASEHPHGVLPILNKDAILPGFGAYLISMDLLARKGVLEALRSLNLQSLIIDECHSFKNPDAARSRALVALAGGFDIKTLGYRVPVQIAPPIKYKIALSGAPIKNRADEYFTILNLLAPEHFRSLQSFRRNWLVQNDKGQYTRIHPYYLDRFKELISRWVIRREKHEALKDLPPLSRDFQYVEIEDELLKKSYNHTLDLFQNFLANTPQIHITDLLGWLARLRAITGQAKCQNAIDYAQEFLDSSEDSLAIGIQHTSVRDTIYYIFDAAGYNPLKLSGEDSAYTKDRVARAFNEGQNRMLVINMIAGGEGLNLQSCANALVLERQWNAANEEQFESRFHRNGQKKGVNITYMIAKGTIDEWFHEMVEEKRNIFKETIVSWDLTTDNSSLRSLAEKAIAHRL